METVYKFVVMGYKSNHDAHIVVIEGVLFKNVHDVSKNSLAMFSLLQIFQNFAKSEQ